jgi:hypothetical protein
LGRGKGESGVVAAITVKNDLSPPPCCDVSRPRMGDPCRRPGAKMKHRFGGGYQSGLFLTSTSIHRKTLDRPPMSGATDSKKLYINSE